MATQEHNTYLVGHKPSHIKNHTWRTAENSAAYLLPTLQSLATSKPNLKLLDTGAGPGSISASLAKYIPQGSVTATDLSSTVLERAAQHARDVGVSNMRCQTANIYELPFADGEFDVVHAHQILCHLDSPLQAMKEMLRVCVTGGVVAVRECDMRMWTFHPCTPGLVEFHKCIMAVMSTAGGSNDMGPRLVSLAIKAGVPREKVVASMGTWCYSTREEREVWGGAMRDRISGGEMRRLVVEKGLGWSEAEMDGMAEAWDEWIEDESGCFGCLNGEVLIWK